MKKKFILFFFVGFLILIAAGSYLFFQKNSQKITNLLLSTSKHSKNFSIDHIVIITMENKSYEDIVGNAHAPFINSLIKSYSFADNFFAVAHPSLPNYLALIGGDTFGITKDCTDCFVSAPNLITQLVQNNLSWKAYMESMPSACYLGDTGQYAQKHNPFIYFDDIRTNPNLCKNIVPYDQLQNDLSSTTTTPNFIWISPNICHDMHDCSVETGDKWLTNNIPAILNSQAFTKEKSLLIITWDEGENSGDNKIPTIFVGNIVKNDFVSHTTYTHYSLLHTIENMWGLSPLTKNVANSTVITDIFQK